VVGEQTEKLTEYFPGGY